jgi:hypothetical protein
MPLNPVMPRPLHRCKAEPQRPCCYGRMQRPGGLDIAADRISLLPCQPGARTLRVLRSGLACHRVTVVGRRRWSGSVVQPVRVRAGQRPPNRAISVPLTPVIRGYSRSLADPLRRRSGRISARTGQIPKLTVRVRFPSPAPTTKIQAAKDFH